MKLELSFEHDYQYQLYAASRDKKKPDRKWLLRMSIYGLVMAIICYYNFRNSGSMQRIAMIFGLFVLYVIATIYSRRYYYKRNLRKYLKDAYKDIEGTLMDLTIEGGQIVVRETGKETRLLPDLFKDAVDTDDYIFLRLQSGGVYIISKLFTTGVDAFVEQLEYLKVPVKKDNWPGRG